MSQDAVSAETPPEDRANLLPETLVVFKTKITAKMRAAKTAEDRHFEAWRAILRTDPAKWRKVFDTEPSRRLEGLSNPLTDANITFTYYMAQESFLKVATMAALTPVEIISRSGTRHSAEAMFVVAGALEAYRLNRETLDLPVKTLLASRVDPVLKLLMASPPDDGLHYLLAVQAAERISEKLTQLDPRAILALVESNVGAAPTPRQVEYTHKRALYDLEFYEERIDRLLSETGNRAAILERGSIGLAEAIPLLHGFDRAWTIRQRLKKLENDPDILPISDELMRYYLNDATATHARGLWRSPAEKEHQSLLLTYRRVLLAAGADPARPIADFEGRIKAFTKAMKPVMLSVALRSLADLQVRLTDALDRGHAHFEGLYKRLLELTDKRGRAGATDAAKHPEFTKLAEAFPLLGYPPAAKYALDQFAQLSDPNLANWTGPRSRRFANVLNSDLFSVWAPHAARAESELNDDKEKVWLADDLIPLVLAEFRTGKDAFLIDVAMEKHESVKNQISLFDILVAVISIALAFVPGGGALVIAARILVTGYDVYALKEEEEDFLAANALYSVGLASDEPSEWGVVLAVAGLGIDLPEFAKMLKLAPGAVADAVKAGRLKSLAKTGKSPRDLLEEFYEAYLREKRKAQIDLWYKKAGEANVLGSVLGLKKEVFAWARIATEIGLEISYEKFAKLARKILNRDIPDKMLREAFDQSPRTAEAASRAFRVDEVHKGIKAFEARAAKVRKLEDEAHDLTAKLSDAAARDDVAAFDDLYPIYDRTEKALVVARADLGHSTQLRMALLERIDSLEEQLKYADSYFFSGSQKVPLKGADVPGGVGYRNLGKVVHDQRRLLQDRLTVLRQIRDGAPMSFTEKWVFHENMVTSWLKREFDQVGYQVRIEVVYLRNGKHTKDIIRVDNLVRLPDVADRAAFKVYDAKFSEVPAKGDLSKAQLLKKVSSDGPQSKVYPAIVDGDIISARLVDPHVAEFFGIASQLDILLDRELILVMNTRSGLMRAEPL